MTLKEKINVAQMACWIILLVLSIIELRLPR